MGCLLEDEEGLCQGKVGKDRKGIMRQFNWKPTIVARPSD
jgi:hypothetical protein